MGSTSEVEGPNSPAFTANCRLSAVGFLFRGSQRQEILRALYGILQAPQELLQIVAAFYEVDVRGVDDQQIGCGVAEEEMFVGARDFLDVLEGNLCFLARGFFGDACAPHFR